MLDLTEKQMLIQALGQVVFDEVQTAIGPIADRILKIEERFRTEDLACVGDVLDHVKALRESIELKISELPKQTPLEIDMPQIEARFAGMILETYESEREWVREYVSGAIDTLPKPERGEKGEPGEQGAPGAPGKDGKDGRDGIDGVDGKSITLDDIRGCLADLVAKAIGDIPIPRSCVGGLIDRGGNLLLTFSDGSHSDLGIVVGRDGKDCDLELVRSQVAAFLAAIEKPLDGKDGKDGLDGVGFDDMTLEHDGDRLLTFKFVKGDNIKVYDINLAIPLFKDVWRQGKYARGDEVVRDGSMWIATAETETVPGSPGSDWRLCTKRGRDGKNGERGQKGDTGESGRPGRDLTQIGPDGSKW